MPIHAKYRKSKQPFHWIVLAERNPRLKRFGNVRLIQISMTTDTVSWERLLVADAAIGLRQRASP
jgi:hypothetical protein